MKDQLLLTADADSIASEKYQIAKDRYVLGNLSITDLSIAFQEKDQAKRDYIAALRDFWGAYYQLRYLSLYDFEKNEKINYKWKHWMMNKLNIYVPGMSISMKHSCVALLYVR